MRQLLFVVMCVGMIVGCGDETSQKMSEEEYRMEYFGRPTPLDGSAVSDYMVVDDGLMVIFSSAPIHAGLDIEENEKMYLKEFKSVMDAVSHWKREHRDERVSIAVSERGGFFNNHGSSSYTVRVVLFRMRE